MTVRFEADVKGNASQPTLYLTTDGFPWGIGEKTFIIPELEALRKRYQVVIISRATGSDYANRDSYTELPEDVGVIHYQHSNILCLGVRALFAPFNRYFREEARLARREDPSLKRIVESLKEYVMAVDFRRFCKKHGVFDNLDNSLFFSFWLNFMCLGWALEKMSLKSKSSMKLVSRVHGYDLYRDKKAYSRGCQPFQWLLREACDRIFFVSQFAKNYFIKEYGDELVKGQYILNRLGVQSGDVGNSEDDLHDGKKLLVSCSNVIPRKRVLLIAEALGRLDSSSIRWVHFGGGQELDKLQQRIAELGLDAEARGHATNAEIVAFYREHHPDGFILLSAYEGGCAVSMQEAISCGIPVIGTDVGGIPEMIDGNGVQLSDDPTPEEVSDAIQTLLFCSAQQAKQMQERSYEIWDAYFNIERNKPQLIDHLNNV